MLKLLLYFIFIQATLLLPSYAYLKQTKLFYNNKAIGICVSYLISLLVFASLSIGGYVLNISNNFIHLIGWVYILLGFIIFIQKKYYKDLWVERIPILTMVALSLISILFINLNFPMDRLKFIPDPEPNTNSNYAVFNVKVLNITQTNANDNYIPYRQAQFIVNRLNPAKDSFIDEWGVHFFQRTPLMGGVTAFYFELLSKNPPTNYLWHITSIDLRNTYVLFQVVASILNSLLIISAYYLIQKLFNKKTAFISAIFLVISQFFLYNSFYTWPKSLVAFFILLSWYCLLQNQKKLTIIAGVASAAAYLTHDLALLYLSATFVLLLINKRYKDIFIVFSMTFIAVLPWAFASAIVYKKASTFYLYPFSVDDIPQPHQSQQIMEKFWHTSILQLITIRLRSLMYLLTPYSLYATKPEALTKRVWALGIFSIFGSVGLGMIIPMIVGLIKKIRFYPFWILLFVPIFAVIMVFGWSYPGSIGALHFAQPITVLLIACGVWWLLSLKNYIWLLVVFGLNLANLIYFMVYSYNFMVLDWFKTRSSFIEVILLMLILGIVTAVFYKAISTRKFQNN